MDRWFGTFFVVQIILVVAMVGAICFGIIKGCDYITSGDAAKDVRTVIETNKEAWDEAGPKKKR